MEPIVVRARDLTPEAVRSNPALSKLQYFSNFTGGHLVGASIATHPRGEECGGHTHRGAVELFLGLLGTGHVVVNGKIHEVGRDDVVVVPAGARHNLIGTSANSPWQVFCALIVAPGHESDKTPWAPVG